jgi:hypothetical protein
LLLGSVIRSYNSSDLDRPHTTRIYAIFTEEDPDFMFHIYVFEGLGFIYA